jgi:hypothetical protein
MTLNVGVLNMRHSPPHHHHFAKGNGLNVFDDPSHDLQPRPIYRIQSRQSRYPRRARLLIADIEGAVLVRPGESAQVSERPPQTAASSTLDRRR